MANAALAQLVGALSLPSVEKAPRSKPVTAAALQHLRQRGLPFTVLHVADLTGTQRATARETLLRWERRGLIYMVREGRRGAYAQWGFVA